MEKAIRNLFIAMDGISNGPKGVLWRHHSLLYVETLLVGVPKNAGGYIALAVYFYRINIIPQSLVPIE